MRGSVLATDGADLPGAELTLTPAGGSPRSATTDANGIYKFIGVAPGRYQLTARLEGFETAVRDVVVQQDGQILQINFDLALELSEEEIVVRGVFDSFGNVTSPTVPLSQGQSFLTLFGDFPFEQLVFNDVLDESIGDVRVLVDNNGTKTPTFPYYGSPNQLATFIGAGLPPGALIQVCQGTICSDPYALNVGRHAPFVAAISGNGIGDAAAQDAEFNLITFLNPVTDFGVLYVNGQVEPGAVGRLFLNGVEQRTLYYGESGNLAQFNFELSDATPSGHVTGLLQELFADGTSRYSQPFRLWVENETPVQDHFWNDLAPQVYTGPGVGLVETLFRQSHQVRLGEANEIIVDQKLFSVDVNLRNQNSQTYNAITPGNFQVSIVPFGYADPRQDLNFSGTAAVAAENFTQFTMSTTNVPNLSQVFADPAGRTFQGAVTVNLNGTVDGSPVSIALQGNYARQAGAIDILEGAFSSNVVALLDDFPESLIAPFRAAEAGMSDDNALFFISQSENYDQFGAVRSDLWFTREQVREEGYLEDRFALWESLRVLDEELPYTWLVSWGIHSFEDPELLDPYAYYGSSSYQTTWLAETWVDPTAGN